MTHACGVLLRCAVTGVVCALAMGSPATLRADLDPALLKYSFNNNGFGTYSFEYETSDGSYRREDGGLSSASEERGGGTLVVRGEYRYVDPEGNTHSVKYLADENGFQPQTHLTDLRFNDRLLP